MLANRKALAAFASPDAAAANSLFTLLAQRFVATYQLLDCRSLVGERDPVSVTINSQGVATSAAVNAWAVNRIVQKLAAQKSQDDWADSVDRERQAANRSSVPDAQPVREAPRSACLRGLHRPARRRPRRSVSSPPASAATDRIRLCRSVESPVRTNCVPRVPATAEPTSCAPRGGLRWSRRRGRLRRRRCCV